MFVQNFYTAMRGWNKAEYVDITRPSGATRNLNPDSGFMRFNSSSDSSTMYIGKAITDITSGSYHGVAFGSGAIEPTFSDYTLSGELITSYTYSASVESSGDSITAVFTITNTADTSITIAEIGLFYAFSYYSSYTYYAPTMLDRTLLDEPITIPAGGVGQVTYTLTLNYPTA